MDYNHITVFLENFKKLLSKSEHVQTVVVGAITKHVAFTITNDMIKIKGGIIYVYTSPLVRNEIFMHKQRILSELKEILPDGHFSDIR